MSRSVAWSLAIRYLKTRRKQFAAFITWVSLLGLALGVLVLTVVVSVMNGFDRELKTRILGTVPHVLIEGLDTEDQRLTDIQALEGVVDAYDFFLGAGMLTRSGAVNPVAIYGIDPEDPRTLRSIAASMQEGSLNDLAGPGRDIVMGYPLASRLVNATMKDVLKRRPSLDRVKQDSTLREQLLGKAGDLVSNPLVPQDPVQHARRNDGVARSRPAATGGATRRSSGGAWLWGGGGGGWLRRGAAWL